ncbi:MAG: GNAT family N-acetyltransferase [Micrococcales bacterium]|nr:GNAT family N-acetyltransferase [Micrococcales bacterium]
MTEPHSHSPSCGHDHADGAERGPLADASVRRATPNDAPAVGMVQAAVWRAAYAGVVPDEAIAMFEPQEFTKVWRRSLESPPAGPYALLVSCAGDQVVGFAAIGPSPDPDRTPETAEILAMGVHPDARRQGHGSRLLNAAIDTLRSSGAEYVNAWVLLDDAATREFLQLSGFGPDSAYRDRVVSPDDDTAREVRLVTSLRGDEQG